jgi:hypothetical protein
MFRKRTRSYKKNIKIEAPVRIGGISPGGLR